jgi:single-stranded DNA-binding protein
LDEKLAFNCPKCWKPCKLVYVSGDMAFFQCESKHDKKYPVYMVSISELRKEMQFNGKETV